MVRASWVLKRQLMVAWAVLRSVTRAWTSRPRASSSGSRCLRQERDSTLNSISAIPSTSSGQDSTNSRAWGCSGTPAVWQSAGPPLPGTPRTATPCGECSSCPGRPGPPRPPDRPRPPAIASVGQSPPSCATNSALTLGMHHSFFCHGLRAFF